MMDFLINLPNESTGHRQRLRELETAENIRTQDNHREAPYKFREVGPAQPPSNKQLSQIKEIKGETSLLRWQGSVYEVSITIDNSRDSKPSPFLTVLEYKKQGLLKSIDLPATTQPSDF